MKYNELVVDRKNLLAALNHIKEESSLSNPIVSVVQENVAPFNYIIIYKDNA